ncbi:hypothetical protein JOC77_001516 [Peribacillus deserti]|uniref:Uncharacterized protein n=1 Tax=Peribacillus deserti TaxID=673318 RepID=A0ABS2QH88_9BACI|nr:hypothetical protein [Peribacillus deserti]MBM7692089.1 hypothetical protein [Peribacillus deserti]
MEKEILLQLIQSMIMSSSKKPKYMSISTVKVADLLERSITEIEQGLGELVQEGRLRTSTLEQPPHNTIYMLP